LFQLSSSPVMEAVLAPVPHAAPAEVAKSRTKFNRAVRDELVKWHGGDHNLALAIQKAQQEALPAALIQKMEKVQADTKVIKRKYCRMIGARRYEKSAVSNFQSARVELVTASRFVDEADLPTTQEEPEVVAGGGGGGSGGGGSAGSAIVVFSGGDSAGSATDVAATVAAVRRQCVNRFRGSSLSPAPLAKRRAP